MHKHNAKLTPRAKELRKNMTPQERHLWYDFLRDYPVRFLRQKVVEKFIVDFYCSDAKLVVELDGSQHYTEDGLQYDEERTHILEKYDLRVLRFTNTEVDNHFEDVCDAINAAVKLTITSQEVLFLDNSGKK